MTSSARTIRRPLLGRMPAAAPGSSVASLGAAQPVPARPARPRAAPGRRGRYRGSSGRPGRRAGTARSHRPGSVPGRGRSPPRWPPGPAADIRPRSRGTARPTRRADDAGMPWRWATVSLAVPMSMPRYSCMESALTISPPSSLASRSARSDLPAAVGPSTAITRSAMLSASIGTEHRDHRVCHADSVPSGGRPGLRAGPPARTRPPPGPGGSGLRGGRGPAGSAAPAGRSCPRWSRPGSAAGQTPARPGSAG